MIARITFIILLIAGTVEVTKAQSAETIIVGDVIDIVSYMTSGVKPDSPAGLEVIRASAKGGNPLGLLEESTGRVYVVTLKQASMGANQALLPWIGTKAAAKGRVYTKGSTRVLVLTTIGKGGR